MSRQRRNRQRGVTLAELMTVMVIFGLISTVVAAVIGPMLRAPNQEQAKVDTIQAVAKALYLMQRDVRQTTKGGVYYCTNVVPTTCTAPAVGATPAPAQTLVITSPRIGPSGALNISSSGAALQQGYNVYWLQQNPNNANETDLVYSFVANPAGWQDQGLYISQHVVDPTIGSSTNPQIVVESVTAMNVGLNVSTNDVELSLTATSNDEPDTNESSFVADTTYRN
jgi:prepilin-type N-terminal cleavage/methylation domain-containing protein